MRTVRIDFPFRLIVTWPCRFIFHSTSSIALWQQDACRHASRCVASLCGGSLPTSLVRRFCLPNPLHGIKMDGASRRWRPFLCEQTKTLFALAFILSCPTPSVANRDMVFYVGHYSGTRSFTFVHMHLYIRIDTLICTHTSIYIYIHIHINIYVYLERICVYIDIYIYRERER